MSKEYPNFLTDEEKHTIVVLRVVEPSMTITRLAQYASEFLNRPVSQIQIKHTCDVLADQVSFYEENQYDLILACQKIGYLKLATPVSRIKRLELIQKMAINGYLAEYQTPKGELVELTKYDLPTGVKAIVAIQEEIINLKEKSINEVSDINLFIIEDNNNEPSNQETSEEEI